ncbi:MAG: SDR family oxidoreductase [Alphaproteobacteria bacterium]|nr:SDR family oxidoreductase [Alphaproteobacteria bacterium]
MSRRALITGAGSGFGLALSRRWLGGGHTLVATDEQLGPWTEELKALAPGRVEICRVDVRDDGDVARALDRVRRTGGGGLDVLVNNAGYAMFGAQEEVDLARFQDLLEVNVVGVARVTRAFLPLIRASAGCVVQLSSVAGRTVFPESGFYAATKHAVEAMSEALFQETCTLGVTVRVIEPGSFDTGFLARAAAESPPPPPGSPYDALRPMWGERKTEVLEPPQPPELVADAILRSLDDPRPFLRIPVGPDGERILGLRDDLGPDDWAAVLGHRAGLTGPDTISPEGVLAGQRIEAARAAARRGHLRHWERTEAGRAALRLLLD